MAINIDNTATASTHGTNTIAITLPISGANDFIGLMAYAGSLTNPGATISTVTATGGLTFTRRAQANTSANGDLEFWWAPGPSSPGVTTITLTYTANFDDVSVVAFAISGVNLSSPFDTFTGLPITAAWSNNSTMPSVAGGAATNGALLLWALATNGAWTPFPGTSPANFTTLGLQGNSGGTNFSFVDVIYQKIGPAQSGTYSWGSIITAGSGEYIFDALVPAITWPGTVLDASGFIRETLSTSPGQIRSGALVRETLNSPPGKIRTGAFVREALISSGTSGLGTRLFVDVTVREVLLSGAATPPVAAKQPPIVYVVA
jgi:hypothetical protein